MPTTRWCPHATVATVVVDSDRFLIVEERDRRSGKVVFNQPAGHLEEGESLMEAAVREVLEETRWRVSLTAYLGVAQLLAADGVSYLRHSFVAAPLEEITTQALDGGIIAAHWLTLEDIVALTPQLRSPLVMQTIDRYRQGVIAPLSLVIDP